MRTTLSRPGPVALGIFSLVLSLSACGDQAAETPKKAEPAGKSEAKKGEAPAPKGPDAKALASKAGALFKPLPEWMGEKASDDMVSLGRTLYYEKRLSKNHDISLQLVPRPGQGRRRQPALLSRAQGPARWSELAHQPQRSAPHRPVLGRTGGRRGGTGQGPHPEPRRDGHAGRGDGREDPQEHPGLRRDVQEGLPGGC